MKKEHVGFGEEWKKEMMKHTKRELVEWLARVLEQTKQN